MRHPLDQWLSLSQLAVMQGRIDLATFLAGYRRFAEVATTIGFERYEDFTADPKAVMKALCASLQLKLDRGFSERWREYTFVTGDISRQPGRRPDPAGAAPPGGAGAAARASRPTPTTRRASRCSATSTRPDRRP